MYLYFKEPGRVNEDASRDDPNDVEPELPEPWVPVRVADPEKALGCYGHTRVGRAWNEKKSNIKYVEKNKLILSF